jgi:hypothetical protein
LFSTESVGSFSEKHSAFSRQPSALVPPFSPSSPSFQDAAALFAIGRRDQASETRKSVDLLHRLPVLVLQTLFERH